jgi:acetyltransferase-like isoleucine patch superfamily enzyme
MNVLMGGINRFTFLPLKIRLKSCGKQSLIEFYHRVEGAEYISIGENVRIKPGLHMAAIDHHNNLSFSPSIRIGNNVSINYNVHIACINEIIIGDGTLLGSKIFITDHYHGNTSMESLQIPPSDRKLESKGSVVIGNNVWIGENVSIMPDVKIGDNAVIGANAVVTKNVPAFSVAVGAPAKIIKRYYR